MDRNIWWEWFRLKAGTRVMGSVSARCTSAALPPRSQGRGDFELCTHCTAQQAQTWRTLKANRRPSKWEPWLLHTWTLFTLHDYLSQTEMLGNPFSPTGHRAEQAFKSTAQMNRTALSIFNWLYCMLRWVRWLQTVWKIITALFYLSLISSAEQHSEAILGSQSQTE